VGLESPQVPPGRLEERFTDKAPALSPTEAQHEANRCLYCHDAPCIPRCPTSIDIPTFIRKIATGNLRGAARTILESNLLGASCARVCPVEVLCESTCVYESWGRPAIPIGRLQRHAMTAGASPDLLPSAAPSGHSVGLVGAGPASLACAGTLALMGHRAVIYEKRSLSGGLNSTGVAPYKMRLDAALSEVEFITSLGVEIETDVEVGVDVTAEELLERHEAVFLGPGLGPDSTLPVPGADGAGVVGAVEWIERVKVEPHFDLGDVAAAVVIGGGNTALDAAQELRGLGVRDVSMIYRRSAAEMSGYAHELSGARAAGTVLVENAAVVEVVRDGEHVTGVRLVECEDGRPTGRDRGTVPTGLVVLAIGQAKLRELAGLFDGVECDDRGRLIADEASGVTGNPRVFAGGDARNGGREVVNAVAEGQAAARSIDARLRGGGNA